MFKNGTFAKFWRKRFHHLLMTLKYQLASFIINAVTYEIQIQIQRIVSFYGTVFGGNIERFLKSYALSLSGPGGGGGAQRPGLTTANQKPLTLWCPTLWLLVFIFKTCSDQILAKLVNQGLIVIEMSQKFTKWKKFPLLRNCWNWHGESQFWVEKNDSEHKNSFF